MAAHTRLEEVLTLVDREETGISRARRVANVSLNLATTAVASGNVTEAFAMLRRSIGSDRTWAELLPYQILVGALVGSAGGRDDQAVVLHAAADALMASSHNVYELVEGRLREADRSRLAERMDPGEFDAALQRGASLSAPDALDLAYSVLA